MDPDERMKHPHVGYDPDEEKLRAVKALVEKARRTLL